MNKHRRALIQKIAEMARTANMMLDDVCADEQIAYDNTPESLQFTDRYDESGESIFAMQEAICSIDNAITVLEEI